MNDRAAFASTLLAMSLAMKMYGRELTGELQKVYWKALEPLSDAEFQRAAEILLRRETEFPPPALFLEAARPSGDPAALAGAALRAVIICQGKHPRSREWYAGAHVQRDLGEAAYQAFHAAGGYQAIEEASDEYHGPGIRRRFMECYERIIKVDPAAATPPPALPPPPPEMARITAGIGRPLPWDRGERRNGETP